jgi:hypothetical protein
MAGGLTSLPRAAQPYPAVGSVEAPTRPLRSVQVPEDILPNRLDLRPSKRGDDARLLG